MKDEEIEKMISEEMDDLFNKMKDPTEETFLKLGCVSNRSGLPARMDNSYRILMKKHITYRGSKDVASLLYNTHSRWLLISISGKTVFAGEVKQVFQLENVMEMTKVL